MAPTLLNTHDAIRNLTDTKTSSILHIAIAGAGIAGLTAAIALSKHPHIDVQLYEKATELREIGASIALGPNGLRTLEKLGIDNALDDDVAFCGPSGFPMIYRHWETNEIVSVDRFKNVTNRRHETARFARAHLQQSLLKHVPSERIHLKKKVVAVNESGEAASGVVLKFEDGTEATADLLIGADGINSGVRTFFVPQHKLGWTTSVAYRAIFDTSLVEGIPDLPEDSTHWWGPNGAVFASKLGRGEFTTIALTQIDPDDPKNKEIIERTRWDDPSNIDYIRELYKDWHPVIRALWTATPSVRVYPNLAITVPLPSYTFLNGRVALIGDAAHPHGGAFATGGSLAIDDAYAFSLALFSVFPPAANATGGSPSSEELVRALSLYERTRKPHTTRLLEIVHAQNEKSMERLRSGVVETDAQLRERMKNRADPSWLHKHDVEAAFRAVLEGDRVGGKEARPEAKL